MRLHGTLRCGLRQAGIFRFAVLLLPSVYASGGHPGMPYARQNGEKCGLALVRQGENREKCGLGIDLNREFEKNAIYRIIF